MQRTNREGTAFLVPGGDPTEPIWEIPMKKQRINVSLTPYAIMELRARSENNGMTLSGYLEWLAHQPPEGGEKNEKTARKP